MSYQISNEFSAILCLTMPWACILPMFGKFFVRSRFALKLLLTFLCIAVVGVCLGVLKLITISTVVVLVIPLYQHSLLFYAYHEFKRLMDRDPANVALNWQEGLAIDRLFAFSIVLFGGIIPLAIARSLR